MPGMGHSQYTRTGDGTRRVVKDYSRKYLPMTDSDRLASSSRRDELHKNGILHTCLQFKSVYIQPPACSMLLSFVLFYCHFLPYTR